MTSCKHNSLVLLPERGNRLRCRHCHLTLRAEDMEEDYCPECFETQGLKQYDFEEIAEEETGVVRYRCEACGLIIAVK